MQDSTDVKRPEAANPWRQKVDERRRGLGRESFPRRGFPFGVMKMLWNQTEGAVEHHPEKMPLNCSP